MSDSSSARVRFVARSDDLGSSNSANQAIDQVTRAGFIKNVSVMAPCTSVEAAFELLGGCEDICFGMHTTLNAEWDKVKWKPVLPLGEKSGLVDENGFFLSDPSLFTRSKPAVETVMKEVDAQLERLHAIGFDIRYIDSHMFPEMFIEGMDEAMEEYARKKGLIDHMYYYAIPPGFQQLQQNPNGLMDFFRNLPDGQYFFITHPSLDTEEMRQTGNAQYSGADVAKGRSAETGIFSNPAILGTLAQLGCTGVRYDEAEPLPQRLNIEAAKALFAQL